MDFLATLTTSTITDLRTSPSPSSSTLTSYGSVHHDGTSIVINIQRGGGGSTGKGILIGMLSAFGSALFIVLVFCLIYFLRFTNSGRILLDRVGRPGQYDDEQAMLREEAEALETMDDMQRAEYIRARSFIEQNPPETMQTDISLSQFLAIQEKGVSAWEFEPELEIANCFVEARTEIEFFDSECTVQSNLPIPKQNEVYYWEAKIYDKPETTLIHIGVTTKPYPLFRLPGLHKCSVAYCSTGHRRFNQPFNPTNYGPEFVQGDVVGVGYRPRTGTIFFTRNGKKLEDVAHGLKSQNFFPSVGANGPCNVHVNFGQSGFVFIEANVKKWGLAPMTGSLAPPPPYGSEQGSILLEAGGEGTQVNTAYAAAAARHGRTRSRYGPVVGGPMSPGPIRSPTDISLAQLAHIPSHEDVGEGTSRSAGDRTGTVHGLGFESGILPERNSSLPAQQDMNAPPPDYESPQPTPTDSQSSQEGNSGHRTLSPRPPVPSYDVAVGQTSRQLYRDNVHTDEEESQDEGDDDEADNGNEATRLLNPENGSTATHRDTPNE